MEIHPAADSKKSDLSVFLNFHWKKSGLIKHKMRMEEVRPGIVSGLTIKSAAYGTVREGQAANGSECPPQVGSRCAGG